MPAQSAEPAQQGLQQANSKGNPARPRAHQTSRLEADLADALHTGPFPVALRAALAARGLALSRVQHRLAQRGIRVGVTSLSYWQRGIRRPDRPESLRAVTALEEVLELPAHALTRLLGPPSTEQPVARPYRSVLAPASALETLLAGLEAPTDGGLHTVAHYEQVRIGAHRELLYRDSHHVVRAHRDGVDRYLSIHQGDPGCDVDRIRVTAVNNCRVGRVRRHADSGMIVAELLLDARLRTGDTAVLGYRFEDGTGAPSDEYVRGFTYGGGDYVLQIAFDRCALPVRCRRFTRTSPSAARDGLVELTLNAHRTVHLVQPEVRAGVLGITWDWD